VTLPGVLPAEVTSPQVLVPGQSATTLTLGTKLAKPRKCVNYCITSSSVTGKKIGQYFISNIAAIAVNGQS